MSMPFVTSLLTALFMMCMVFLVLALLWAILRVVGAIFLKVEETANINGAQTGQKG